MGILIKNGRLINPATNTDEVLDVLTNNGQILAIEEYIDMTKHSISQVIDASGCFVMPGLIDMHVHLREPGLTYKEDIETGSLAAAKGGFTTIVAMANTSPVIDNGRIYRDVLNIIDEKAAINVLQTGTLTRGMAGMELSAIGDMAVAGAIAFSDDGKTVMNANLFREALEEVKKYNLLVLAHCEDENLKGEGIYNQGDAADGFGVPGISNSVEDVIVARDIVLSEETDTKLHICHCSTKGSVELVRMAKYKGLKVTAEVTPHHLILTDDDIEPNNSNYKMAPPLRKSSDIRFLINGLKDGTIDVIASDHAPHAAHEKGANISTAAFGISGLETMLSLIYTHLVKPGAISPMEMVKKMSFNPARILGIDKGNLTVGKDADITIMDPSKELFIDKDTFISKGKNTPFQGQHVSGEVVATLCKGKIVYDRNHIYYSVR